MIEDEALLSCYDFGRQLLETLDLDPVYVVLYNAELEPELLQRWLLAYWGFYHVGTASWIAEAEDLAYWDRMRTAAGSKDYPRSSERRHFRGENARKSVEFLQSQGLSKLFSPFARSLAPATIMFVSDDYAKQTGAKVGDTVFHDLSAEYVVEHVKTWVGFGPWIAFKVADMLERLGLARIHFDVETAMYEGSPTEGAQMLWEEEGKPPLIREGQTRPATWAVARILSELRTLSAPPDFKRIIGPQEAETILCKWFSYTKGHYHLGEDIKAVRSGLLRFGRTKLAQRLFRGGREGGLW